MAREFEYVRLFADEAGESHFEDVRVAFEEAEYAQNTGPVGQAQLGGAESLLVTTVTSAESDASELHVSPARQFLTPLVGSIEVTASDGETRRIDPGRILLFEDLEGRGHSATVTEDLTTIIVRLPRHPRRDAASGKGR